MKKLIKPFLLILACTIVAFLVSIVYGFCQSVPAILAKDEFGYRLRMGIVFFCKLLFVTFATGITTGFSWAFATEADPKKHRTNTYMLPQLKNVLIVVTACTLLYILGADLIQPTTESRMQSMIQDAENFEEFTLLAKEHAARKDYATAYFYASQAYSLNPDDADAKNLAKTLETEMVSVEIVIESGNEEVMDQEKKTSLEMAYDELILAQNYMEAGDYWNAHYHAVCAEDMSPRDDETKKKARELAAVAWNKMSSYTEGVAEETITIYESKKRAYDYLEKGDTLQAYYAFKTLSEKYPKDEEISTYFGYAKARLEETYFYSDEIEDKKALEKYSNVSFTMDTQSGCKEKYDIKGITVVSNTGQLIQYLRDMDITRYDANGKIQNVLHVPYAKMTGQDDQVILTTEESEQKTITIVYKPFLQLESVNKNVSTGLRIKPSWIVSDGTETPSWLLLDMPYDDFTLIRQASVGSERMPLISLFKFVKIADNYGFSASSFRTTLVLRLSLPLFVLSLLLYMAVIGWGLRLEADQPFKTRWILMFPLFASVTYIGKDLLLYILKLLVFALCDWQPVLALWGVVIAAFIAVLFTSIYFMNLRSE